MEEILKNLGKAAQLPDDGEGWMVGVEAPEGGEGEATDAPCEEGVDGDAGSKDTVGLDQHAPNNC